MPVEKIAIYFSELILFLISSQWNVPYHTDNLNINARTRSIRTVEAMESHGTEYEVELTLFAVHIYLAATFSLIHVYSKNSTFNNVGGGWSCGGGRGRVKPTREGESDPSTRRRPVCCVRTKPSSRGTKPESGSEIL